MVVPLVDVTAGVFKERKECELSEIITLLTGYNTSNLQLARKGMMEEWNLEPIGPLIGVNNNHIIPYMSDPSHQIKGAFGVIDKKIVYMPRAPGLEDWRDGYLWSYTQHELYTQCSLKEILLAMESSGYEFMQYKPPMHMPLFLYQSSMDQALVKHSVPVELIHILRNGKPNLLSQTIEQPSQNLNDFPEERNNTSL